MTSDQLKSLGNKSCNVNRCWCHLKTENQFTLSNWIWLAEMWGCEHQCFLLDSPYIICIILYIVMVAYSLRSYAPQGRLPNHPYLVFSSLDNFTRNLVRVSLEQNLRSHCTGEYCLHSLNNYSVLLIMHFDLHQALTGPDFLFYFFIIHTRFVSQGWRVVLCFHSDMPCFIQAWKLLARVTKHSSCGKGPTPFRVSAAELHTHTHTLINALYGWGDLTHWRFGAAVFIHLSLSS